jgi:hypothetical protein
MFEGALEKLNIPALLPRTDPEETPLEIQGLTTYVSGCQTVIPDHNNRTQTYYGPFWDFSDPRMAIGTYAIKTKELNDIRNGMRAEASSNRYVYEISGTKCTLQGLEVTIDTSRPGRDIFVQKFSIMSDAETVNWKFPEGWLTISKAELGTCIAAGAAHIQGAFDWEKNKNDEITAASTVDELAAIDLNVVTV